MVHRNSPLSLEARLRLVKRCESRPISHVAKEMGVSRACASKWVNRHRVFGELGLHDRSSAPKCSPNTTPARVVTRIEALRRERKWPASRISFELGEDGTRISRRTVTSLLARLGLNRRKFIDPEGETNRAPRKIVAKRPGHMVHLDVKKVGRIPDGGGWRAHGKGSEQDKAAQRAKAKGARAGYVFLHSAVDGFSRLAYTEPLADERAATAVGFLTRARVFFAAHGITRVEQIRTDNGSCYRADAFARALHGAKHKRTRPYTPRHNGKVERYQRTLTEELLFARTWQSEQQRADAIAVWNIHHNYHRPHSTAGGEPPASRLRQGVTNVQASYS